ncbi:MAG: multidrug efflux SMR transporter [Pseudomonadota bacterium]
MAWVWLILAGLLEIAWAVGLKHTAGFTFVAMGASVYFLALAVRAIPIGTAYAVWSGIGAAGVALLGMALFDEPRTAARLGFIGLIVAGIVGLWLSA